MMMNRSQYGRPRIGTGWFRNGTFRLMVIVWVWSEMIPLDGVTTTEYAPSAASAGTFTVPKNKPRSWELVVLKAMTCVPDRSSIVRATPMIPAASWSRTYPVTLIIEPGWISWPAVGVTIRTAPVGGWMFREMFTKLLFS